MTPNQHAINGLIGTASSGLAVISTFQEQLEWWIRISGGMLGIVIAVWTLYRMCACACKETKEP